MEENIFSPGDLQSCIEKEAALLLYFYNNNCAPCHALRPKVKELLDKEFPKMKMLLINGQENPELTASMGVFSWPALLVFFEGKEYFRKSNYVSMEELRTSISRLYNLALS